jgi:peptide methionine sulfoxide reductase MsrB
MEGCYLLAYPPAGPYFCRLNIKNLLSFGLNSTIICEANLYYYYDTYHSVTGWHHLFPGILAKEYDLIAAGTDKGKN